MAEAFSDGNNSLVIAYGQTSSVKTTFLGLPLDSDKKLLKNVFKKSNELTISAQESYLNKMIDLFDIQSGQKSRQSIPNFKFKKLGN